MGLESLALRLSCEVDPARTLDLVVEALVEEAGAERGLAMRWDGRRFVGPARERFSATVMRRMRADRRPLVFTDAPVELSGSRSVQAQGARSVLAVPLAVGEELIGAVYLDHADPNRFADVERLAPLIALAAAALDRARRTEEAARLECQLRASRTKTPAFDAIVGESAPIRRLIDDLKRMIDIDYPVLVEGESGTGKELVARALHFGGRRAEEPFIPANCGGMNEQLLAAELFGHVRGAFTGADRDRPGLFEAADGGTLFLDEIEAMSPAMQEALLRSLESGEVRRVGDSTSRTVNARVIAATNVPLDQTGFRKDLFYRIAVLRVTLPPLRVRPEDIPVLAGHFLGTIAAELGRPRCTLTPEAMHALVDYSWPGNVRELLNALKRAAALSRGPEIRPVDLEFLGAPAPDTRLPLMTVDEYVQRIHATYGGAMDDEILADKLGISRKTLWAKRKRT